MVFNSFSYFRILGLSVVVWLGMLALLCLLFTATISVLNKKGNHKIPMKWHPIMARVTIVLALLHFILAMLARL
ncbi:hypothetical protein KY359_06785 [Candidatus Woesearchaeota archaeon]|nr:hypothetical protein [Candidatus Woesearchaeota archaeon]